jgi:hypothetical protein
MRYNLEGAINNLPRENITILDITNDYIEYSSNNTKEIHRAYYADDGEIIKIINKGTE